MKRQLGSPAFRFHASLSCSGLAGGCACRLLSGSLACLELCPAPSSFSAPCRPPFFFFDAADLPFCPSNSEFSLISLDKSPRCVAITSAPNFLPTQPKMMSMRIAPKPVAAKRDVSVRAAAKKAPAKKLGAPAPNKWTGGENGFDESKWYGADRVLFLPGGLLDRDDVPAYLDGSLAGECVPTCRTCTA